MIHVYIHIMIFNLGNYGWDSFSLSWKVFHFLLLVHSAYAVPPVFVIQHHIFNITDKDNINGQCLKVFLIDIFIIVNKQSCVIDFLL